MQDEEHHIDELITHFVDEQWRRFDAVAAKRASGLQDIATKIKWLQWAADCEADGGMQEMARSLSRDIDAIDGLQPLSANLPRSLRIEITEGDQTVSTQFIL